MNTNEIIVQPDCVTQKHLEYLDRLRESGVTNMYGARPYLVEEFSIDLQTASKILTYWMKTFAVRHPRSDERLTVKQLGKLRECDHCHAQTYDRKNLPDTPGGVLLPEGFTKGHARHYLTVHHKHIVVCENCRYDVYGAY